MKFDLFVKETNDRFTDYEYAIAEIEKNIQLPEEVEQIMETPQETQQETHEETDFGVEQQDLINPNEPENNAANIMSVDLKNMIKQELANETA